jgi:DNA repair exonuclease SbcCD ATPase subunit
MADELNFPVNIPVSTPGSETAVKSFGDIRREIKQIESQMIATQDKTSVAFKDMATKAGLLNEELRRTTETVKAFSGPPLENISHGFKGIEDSIIHLDLTSFNRQITNMAGNLKNVNFSQVIGGIKSTMTAFIQLGAALLTNPIFLLVAAIAAIGIALKLFADHQDEVVKKEIENNDKRHKSFQEYLKDQEKIQAAMGKSTEQLKLSGAQDIQIQEDTNIKLIESKQHWWKKVSDDDKKALEESKERKERAAADEEAIIAESIHKLDEIIKRQREDDLKARAKNEVDKLKLEQQASEDEIDLAFKTSMALLIQKGASEKEQEELEKKYIEALTGERQDFSDKEKKAQDKIDDEKEKKAKELSDKLKKQAQEYYKAQEESLNKLQEIAKKDTEKSLSLEEQKNQKMKELHDAYKNAINDGANPDDAYAAEAAAKLGIDQWYAVETKKIADKTQEDKNKALKKELDDTEKDYQLGLKNKVNEATNDKDKAKAEQALAFEVNDAIQHDDTKTQNEKKAAQLEYEKVVKDSNKKIADDAKKNAKETEKTIEDSLKSTTQLINSVESLQSALMKNKIARDKGNKAAELKDKKEEFNTHKALSLAKAGINIAEAITKDAANPAKIVFDAILGGIEIATIASAKFDPGSSGDSGGGGGSVPSVPSLSAPQTFGLGAAPKAPIGQTQPTKVYVTESDITNTQNKVTVSQGRSTLV